MKYSLEYAQQCAAEHNGICLSKEYTKMTDLMRWQCEAGHQWEARLKTVRDYHWCLKCQSIKEENDALQRAKDNNIIRIFRDWKGEINKWQCQKDHLFISSNTGLNKCTQCQANHERFQQEVLSQSNLFTALNCDIAQELILFRESERKIREMEKRDKEVVTQSEKVVPKKRVKKVS